MALSSSFFSSGAAQKHSDRTTPGEFPSPTTGGGDDGSEDEGVDEPPPPSENTMKENPFDSSDSRTLFDAIDKLQSCGVSQQVDIPQLVIVGGQSTGKSSLLQSLTDIPFPVGTGCCTRFATRIVSRRTPPNTANRYNISIVASEVEVNTIKHLEEADYKDFHRTGEVLDLTDFEDIMDEVSYEYLGIEPGPGIGKKNFACEVLRVELSGPARSHFSILDVPGVFTNPYDVKEDEMKGVHDMVVEYMKKEENIVICVADAVTDLANQQAFALATKHVDKKRLVGVFTKCDMLATNEQMNDIVAIATGQQDKSSKAMQDDGWFVVRNRNEADKEKAGFDLAAEEEKLFGTAPWNALLEDRRGSNKLRQYLSSLLCARIRDNFPGIQERVGQLLREARTARSALGNPRPTRLERVQYLRDVVQRFEVTASRALEKPGLVPELMRVRGEVKNANDAFARKMQVEGHAHPFQDPDMDPVAVLALTTTRATMAAHSAERAPGGDLDENDDGDDDAVDALKPAMPWTTSLTPTPPISPPRGKHNSEKYRHRAQTHGQNYNKQNPKEEFGKEGPLFEEIRSQLRASQSTQLPGLINPEVVPLLFQQQTNKWQTMAEEHIRSVAWKVGVAANAMVRDVCPPSEGHSTLHHELVKSMEAFYHESLSRAVQELKTHCLRERFNILQTTDARFHERIKALRTLRLLRSLELLGGPAGDKASWSPLVYDRLHLAMEDNMAKEVHDVLKVYYQISIESFIRHVTHNIVEDLVSSPRAPLKRLSTDWVYGLDDAEIERLAREDDDTIAMRARYDGVIDKLQVANEIAQRARDQTTSLGAM